MADPVQEVLDEAAKLHRERRGAAEPDAELFSEAQAPAIVAPSGRGGARPGAGRPPASINRSSRELRAYLVGKFGVDAIEEGYAVLAQPMGTDKAALQKFADHLGCDRLKAFDRYLSLLDKLFPFIYPRLASLELKPPGAPGELGPLFDFEGYGHEITEIPDEPPEDVLELDAAGDAAAQP